MKEQKMEQNVRVGKDFKSCLNLHSSFLRWGNRYAEAKTLTDCHTLVTIKTKPSHFQTGVLLIPSPFLVNSLYPMCTWLNHLCFHYGCSVDNMWDLTHDSVKMKHKVRNTSKLYMQFTQQDSIKTNSSYWPHGKLTNISDSFSVSWSSN